MNETPTSVASDLPPAPAPPGRRKTPYALFVLLLVLDVSGFLLEKTASTRAAGEGWAFWKHLLTHPWAWAALAMGPLQLWTWTRILANFDLSLAYPMSSLNLPVTLVASHLLLGENLPWQVWAGALLITLGGVILGGGSHPTPPPHGCEPLPLAPP